MFILEAFNYDNDKTLINSMISWMNSIGLGLCSIDIFKLSAPSHS